MAELTAVIREMGTADIDGVIEIEAATFSSPWSREMLADELGGSGRHYLVAEVEGSIACYGGVMVAGDEGHLMTLATRRDHRGRGLASDLLVRLLRWAVANGASHLLLEVRPSALPARRMYQKFGFAPVGIRPGYYRDEDAIVMWVDDAGGAEYAERLDALERSC